ncbi:hypothetical protein HK096_002384 [Nowakowskiella sp. JEL0078]|nr:hypothetical protein HK096_002384 [Nowakowskiella sp. JEL0078]
MSQTSLPSLSLALLQTNFQLEKSLCFKETKPQSLTLKVSTDSNHHNTIYPLNSHTYPTVSPPFQQQYTPQLNSYSNISSFIGAPQLKTIKYTQPYISDSDRQTPVKATKASNDVITKLMQLERLKRKIFACDYPFCGKSFTRKYNLDSHKTAAHTANRPFVCDICKASFSRTHDLRRHVRSLHADDRPFECGYCNQTFSRGDALKRHLGRDQANCSRESRAAFFKDCKSSVGSLEWMNVGLSVHGNQDCEPSDGIGRSTTG